MDPAYLKDKLTKRTSLPKGQAYLKDKLTYRTSLPSRSEK